MNQLKSFNHYYFGELQVINVDGKDYFGASDVARALEYKQPHIAVRAHCDMEGVITRNVPTNGGNQDKRFITMGNVSRLIVGAAKQSQNPEISKNAKMYEKWIFDEVIPKIHQSGSYSLPSSSSNKTKLLLKTALEHEEKIEIHDKRISFLEETMRVDGIQERKLQNKGNQIAIEFLGGKDSPAYRKVARKVFSELWRDFKNHFMIPRYAELPKKQFEEGLRFIGMWQPSTSLRIEIEQINNQQVMKEVI